MRHQVASPALSNYETIAKVHLRPILGKKKVSKLKPAEIDALLSEKLDGGLSVSTVRRIRSVLAQALTQAQRWEMVGRNAASLSRPPRAPRSEGRSLSPEQVGELVTAWQGCSSQCWARVFAVVRPSLSSGMISISNTPF
jgi:site-specific recombinase XerD